MVALMESRGGQVEVERVADYDEVHEMSLSQVVTSLRDQASWLEHFEATVSDVEVMGGSLRGSLEVAVVPRVKDAYFHRLDASMKVVNRPLAEKDLASCTDFVVTA